MIEPQSQTLVISRQLELIKLSLSSYYYKSHARAEQPEDARIKAVIQDIYTEQPVGYRVMHGRIQQHGYSVGEKVVRRLMREQNLYGPYPKRNLSKVCHEHKKYPYLLRDLEITHINQVWATDITYINLDKGTAYLLAVIDKFWNPRDIQY